MQLSASRSLASAISDAEITVLTPFPDIDKQTYRDVRVRGSSRRRPFTALTLLVRAWLWRILSSMLRIDLKALIGSAELQEYARADVVVDLSGDTLTNDYGVASTVSHLVPILTAIALLRPVVVCAQSIGPLGAARPLARFALNRVSVVTAREEITSAYLDDLGVHRPQRELTADMAFLLEPARPERVSEIMVAEGLDRTDRPLVGIALSRLMGHRFSPRDPSAFEDMMAGMADHMAEQLQAFVALVAHVTGPGERRDDRVVARAVRNKMRSADHTAVVEGDYLPDELKGVFSRFELFVGMRMHANIAALSMCVPTIAIGYSQKTRGIMRMAGQERWVSDIDQVTTSNLTAQVDALWDDRSRVRQELETRMAEVRRSAERNALLTGQLITTAGARSE